MGRLRRVLTPGQQKFVATDRRELILVPGGAMAYLWIGNRDKPMHCYGTLSGAKSLRRLAEAILREVAKP